ncbi:uncharacterized protein LOC127250370 [Andrographis paniculata]|uniref:uncharacterized protein LOC127250370 n=1 Tax=Andrographis paniculata TaxID=175694 RepID=UPI0021E732B6|nr:uncharacterized protein LOC127250370 [Andrographis paniculata]
MSWCRRPSKFIFDSFRSHCSKIAVPKVPIEKSVPRPDFNAASSRPRARISSISQPILRQSHLHSGKWQSPFMDGARRFYYVDRRMVHHFKPRGFKRWFQNPKNVLIVVMVGSVVVITVYMGNLETVPYTKRTHFVLLSSNIEKELGESEFKKLKAQFKGKMLPPLHPESIRIQRISQEIIGALERGLSKEQVWSDIMYSAESAAALPQQNRAPEMVTAMSDTSEGISEEEKWPSEDKWQKDEEILDDQWVVQSRKKGQEKGKATETAHLEGLNWEIIVVNEPVINAVCLPGGKIVVFSGLLKHFKTDAEIATVIGHEVAHAVARHTAEQISKNLWWTILQVFLYQFFMPDVVNTLSNLFLRLPFSRRMEMEADYIGLLLIASAGYDPRVAPQVYEKLGKVVGDSALQNYLATHPSGKKRAQVLAQAKVMEEALSIYREVKAGHGVEGFL